jgi:histidine decarboxylase
MDYNDFQNKLQSSYPAIINLNIRTTVKGGIDDLDKILEILEAKQIKEFYIHCDRALGGMLIPYLVPELINFNRPIHSLSISGHKFIGCPFPCGVVLTYKDLVDKLASDIEYIGSKDTTIGGSRNGHTPLFLWYAIQKRKDLFTEEVNSCIFKATYLHNQLTKAGLSCLLNAYSTTVVFPNPSDEVVKKWQLATENDLAHIVVMQHHSYDMIENLIADIIGREENSFLDFEYSLYLSR